MNRIAFKVKKTAEKAILQGHPWVFQTSIAKQSKEGHTGDTAIIFDQRKNQFLALGLYESDSPIAIRIIHVGAPSKIGPELWRQKLQTALDKRSNLLKTDTTAYRLCYGENDGFPGLIIDIYGQNAVIKLYSGIWITYLNDIVQCVADILDIKCVILRLNRKLKASSHGLSDGSTLLRNLEKEEVAFREHGLTFNANLIKGHKTGYFLDHRHNRLEVRGLSKGRKVLDVFAYAGGFSVNALAGGAREVTSLDISSQALQIAQSNSQNNGYKDNHHIIVGDAFDEMKKLASKKITYDLIIIDPPSFAKSEDQVSKAKHHYKRLVRLGIPLLAKKGILLMASCSSRITPDDFYSLVVDQMKQSGRPFNEIKRSLHDDDHPIGIPELTYLKSIYFEVF